MTTDSAHPQHAADIRSGRGARAQPRDPAHSDVPVPADRTGPSASEGQLHELLAPFVAWLATQNLDEPERRRHRAAAERFLRWDHTDTGPIEDRRRRYERYLNRHDPDHLPDARAGLGWWTQHRQLLACTTLPTDR